MNQPNYTTKDNGCTATRKRFAQISYEDSQQFFEDGEQVYVYKLVPIEEICLVDAYDFDGFCVVLEEPKPIATAEELMKPIVQDIPEPEEASPASGAEASATDPEIHELWNRVKSDPESPKKRRGRPKKTAGAQKERGQMEGGTEDGDNA